MEFDLSPLWISLKTSITATALTFILGIAAARFMVSYRWYGKGLLDGLFTLPMVLPPTVLGFILLIIFGKNGIIGKLLMEYGIKIIFSWPATVIAATVVAFPLMYRTARGGFEQVDENILNAARTLGASEWVIFWRVILPITWPSILAGAILSFARALGEFGATLMLAGNIPGRTQTIPIAIYFTAEGGNLNFAWKWVSIIIAISLVTIISLNYWSKYQLKYLTHSRGVSDEIRG